MAERTFLTAGLWFFSAIVLAALFISAAAQGELTQGHIILAVMIISVDVIATPLLARWKDSETAREKEKREHIDNILRDMSDEELITLRQRLSSANPPDENISNYVSSDGELVNRS